MEHKTSNFQAKSPEMDPGIWSRLPEHLLEHVLSLLPLKTFLQLQPTCKHFKSLIFSPNFVAKHVSSSSKSPFSLRFSCSLTHSSATFTISTTQSSTPGAGYPSPPLPRYPAPPPAQCSSASPTASSVSLSPHSSSFLVCNLLQKSSRVVNFPKKYFRFELFTLVPSPNGYKLFMLCSCSGSSNNTFVYDSTRNLWHQFDRVDSFLGDKLSSGRRFLQRVLVFHVPGAVLDSLLRLRNLEMAETRDPLAARAYVLPASKRWVRQILLDWRNWAGRDFEGNEVVGIGWRWGKLGGD
ncbi:Galactose oxidase/kelch repeat superfamily protein [Actinidia rufa]|uniref:Galactose oxidase/kelch repeat superfamily protein n=1 Tax=Actinidia rufa TaxID=165716 RepID=A0A7J0EHQ2_9ERIC|nr:Galactose oxidase/kelch repeat superfamily protein [Actinidia rufa]